MKNAHLLRCAHHASLRRTKSTPHCLPAHTPLGCVGRQKATWHYVPLYAPFRGIQATRYACGCWLHMVSHALHLNIFEQPVCIDFFNILLEHISKYCSLLKNHPSKTKALSVRPEPVEGRLSVHGSTSSPRTALPCSRMRLQNKEKCSRFFASVG